MGENSDQGDAAEMPVSIEVPPELGWLAGKKGVDAEQAIVYSGPRNSNPMNRKPGQSILDRLIAMASDEKPAEPPRNEKPEAPTELEAMPVFGDQGHDLELEHNPMWKALLQFRALLPYVSRMLDMSHTEGAPAGLSTELKQSVGDLAVAQRDLRAAMQDQMAQLKHLEEEVTRTREVTERNTNENLEVLEDVRAVQSTVKKAGVTVGILLFVLIGLVTWLLVRGFRFH
ncbi:MAG TPA: hypothetical protein VHX60_16270 [Acidobacteriaceae bacterium]|jgi:hypothetical protein|nr:hypothetical protein [Acidobacteriaceae bacterium]